MEQCILNCETLPKHSLNHFSGWYKCPQRKTLLINVINLVRQYIKRYATVSSLISVEIIIYKYSSVFPRHINELEKMFTLYDWLKNSYGLLPSKIVLFFMLWNRNANLIAPELMQKTAAFSQPKLLIDLHKNC